MLVLDMALEVSFRLFVWYELRCKHAVMGGEFRLHGHGKLLGHLHQARRLPAECLDSLSDQGRFAV